MRFRFSFVALLVCIGVSVLYVLPQMQFRNPNFIDVVETWSVGTSVWKNTVEEFSNEMRFWPSLKFERSILNTVFSYNPQWYFFYFSIMLTVTFSLGLLLTRLQIKDWILVIFSLVLLYISPITVDTYWRLGAAETLFTLLIVGSLYLFMHKYYTGAVILLFLLMGTKETAVYYIPIYMLMFFIKRRFYLGLLLSSGYVLYLFKIYELTKYAITNPVYTSMLSRSVADIFNMFIYIVNAYAFYSLIFWMAIILFAFRVLQSSVEEKNQGWDWGYSYLAFGIAGLFALITFQNKNQPYYAFPWVTMNIFWLTWEVEHASKIKRNIIIICASILFLVLNIPNLALVRVLYWQRDYAGDNALIEMIEKTSNTHTYSFLREYRPEYIPALRTLSEIRGWSDSEKIHYFILSKEESKNYSDSQSVCGKTFFGTSACKWSVIRL